MSRLRPYEVMVIFDAGLDEEPISGVLDRATELLRSRGGNPGRVDRWGRRRFAYELHHRWEGSYVLIEATDEVIRHKVIRLPEKVAGRAPRPMPAPEPVASAAEGGAQDANGA